MRKIVFHFRNINESEFTSENQNTSKRVKSNTEIMYDYIDEAMKSQKCKMGLGIHAIRKEKIKSKSVDEVLKEICDGGLDIKKGSSVLATISSLGVSTELKNYQREALKNYRLGSEMAENGVVVLVPTILEKNGEKIFQKNMNHFLEMTDEEKGTFIKSLSDRLTEQQRKISQAVIAGDMQKLEQLSVEMYGNRDGGVGENTVIQKIFLKNIIKKTL